MMQTESIIRTEKLTKQYRNGFKAVDGINLAIHAGDVFGFLGPNGAGKTTTIRMLDGLLQPTSGSVWIEDTLLETNTDFFKSTIGVVPESHGYYYWMTAREYLTYFSALFGNASSDDEIENLLQRVGLSKREDTLVGEYSRGMKQRLGIAKSLVGHPKLIFLDEPTLGLDPEGQQDILQLIKDINHKEKITVFITSHLLNDIEQLCNRVAIIRKGVLVAQGEISELKARYQKFPEETVSLETVFFRVVGSVVPEEVLS